MQATLPPLTRSALQRCLPRHGINRLPEMDGDTPATKRFTADPSGDFPLDIAEVRTAAGKLSPCVAIDRTCTCTSAELHEEANTMVAAQCLRHVVAIVPDKIHTVRTDHGMQCTHHRRARDAFQQIFERVCQECGIEHRLTATNHPWTNGQVERMNRMRKDATVKKYHDQTHHHLNCLDRPSSWPITSRRDSRRSPDSHLMSTSVNAGKKTQNAVR